MSATLYEMLYIIDSSLDENLIQQLLKEIKGVIVGGGGEILKESNWGKRPLSFPIKKKTEGFYINVDFSGPFNLPSLITEYVSTHAGILRHLTLKVPKARLLQQKQDEEKKEKELQAARAARDAELASTHAANQLAADSTSSPVPDVDGQPGLSKVTDVDDLDDEYLGDEDDDLDSDE